MNFQTLVSKIKTSVVTLLIILPFTLYLLPSVSYAEGEFSVDSVVSYRVQDSGNTQVTHDTTLENNFSTLYATTYTLTLENIEAKNVHATDDKGNTLQVDIQTSGIDKSSTSTKTTIEVTFADVVVGMGSKRHFFISYDNSNFAVRTGEVWEVSIPKLGDQNSFRNYTVSVFTPKSFGLEAYISPKPISIDTTDSGRNYIFNKSEILQTGITAGFGQFQVFSFNLSYHLENPLNISSETQVAIPPDTAFQKIYYSKIDPQPNNVQVDEDGNWLANFKLTPRERVDVNVSGTVQIFASYRNFPKPTNEVLSQNLSETQYWQVNDPNIKSLATTLKTPKAIYDYVVKTLKYDFSRVQPNVQRMGAISALQNPSSAICMEFTDTFIAIARAAGIPAREINGYAYTENPDLQPLSLVADVLHSWPEYYDKDKGAWIPIDPTWGNTTGGENFFDKLDLRHFTFVNHGKDSTKPYPPGSYKLGSNPQKDVYVSFGKLPIDKISIPNLTITNKKSLPFTGTNFSIKISNSGPVALYSLNPTVFFDGNLKTKFFTPVLPPYGNYNVQIKVPFSLLGKNTPDTVKVEAAGSNLDIPTNKTQVIINSLLIVFGLFFIIMIFVFIRLKRITFVSIYGKIAATYEKLTGKTFQNKPPT